MGEVVSNVTRIADARPHLCGPAYCVDCRHKWEAVAPIGMTVMTCPNCGQNKGARLAMVRGQRRTRYALAAMAYSSSTVTVLPQLRPAGAEGGLRF